MKTDQLELSISVCVLEFDDSKHSELGLQCLLEINLK